MLVDAHHHLWNLKEVPYPWLEARGVRRFFGDPSAIQQDYGVRDFQEDWSGLPVAGSVHVQVGAAPGFEVAETRWLDEQARQTGLPSAIVAFADLTAADLDVQLGRHAEASDLLRGVRQIVSRHPDEDADDEGAALLSDPSFSSGLRLLQARGLSFDLQLTAPLLPLAAEIFSAMPELPVALCHAGSPWARDPASLREWRAGLRQIARLPAAACKLSGLGMFDPDWTADSLAPIVETVLDCFGPERVMWGSNFPVDSLYQDYFTLFTTVRDLVPATSREAVFGHTAKRFYRISD